jgi:hypothetical protein
MSTEAAQKPLPISPALGKVLDVIFAADLPVLLSGSHGIGKSQYLEHYAHQRRLIPYVLDLSLLEATDLTGLPYREDGITRFAPPATLPPVNSPPCILILEELNRCDRSVRQPCLQLLTTRRLNDYQLPANCRLAACINPHSAGYDVDALDPALASRFVILPVEPERASWVVWATEAHLYPGVVRFVEKFSQAFERSPPRTWTQAARLIEAGLCQGWKIAELETLLQPVLKPITAKALLMELPQLAPEVPPEKLLASPKEYLPLFQGWSKQGRLDNMYFVLDLLKRHLDSLSAIPEVSRSDFTALLATVPPDLATPILARLKL